MAMLLRNRIIVVLVLAVATILVVSQSHPEPVLDLDGPLQTDEHVAFWRMRIKDAGAAAAYEELARALAEKKARTPSFTLAEQHTAAHPFGSALYEEMGLEGISVCDDRFTYGCLHTFFGRAIEESSLDVVKLFDEHCKKIGGVKGRNCQHGLGHGILGYFGYDIPDLNDALAVCRLIGNDGITGACYGGAFMEYNMRSLWFEKDSFRPVGELGLAEPCRHVPTDTLPACFARLPQWWRTIIFEGATSTEAFRALGEHCRDQTLNEQERLSCAIGLGHQASIGLEQDMGTVISHCAAAFPDAAGQAWCTTGGIRRLRESDVPFDERYCAHLPEPLRAPCIVSGTGDTDEWNEYDEAALML